MQSGKRLMDMIRLRSFANSEKDIERKHEHYWNWKFNLNLPFLRWYKKVWFVTLIFEMCNFQMLLLLLKLMYLFLSNISFIRGKQIE